MKHTELLKDKIADDVIEWRINTAGFLKEVFDHNPKLGGVLRFPINVLRNFLIQIAERASEINDTKLNAIMAQMALYDRCDPYSKDYDSDFTKALINKKYMNDTIQIGSQVERIGSSNTGRRGTVEQIETKSNDVFEKTTRYRVRWLFEKDGKPVTTCGSNSGKGVRTWVNKKFIKLLTVLILFIVVSCSPRYERCDTYGNMQGSKHYYKGTYKHLNP